MLTNVFLKDGNTINTLSIFHVYHFFSPLELLFIITFTICHQPAHHSSSRYLSVLWRGGRRDVNNISYDAKEPRGLSGSSRKFETDDVTSPTVYLEDAPPILLLPPKLRRNEIVLLGRVNICKTVSLFTYKTA